MPETARDGWYHLSPSGRSASVEYARLDEFRRVLDAGGVRYWVSPGVISHRDDPEITYVYFGEREDPAAVRRLLDGLP